MNNKQSSILIILLFAITCVWVTFNIGKWKDPPQYWEYDVGGYYSYLPAIFIYHDLGTMDAYGRMEEKYFPTQKKYGYYHNPETGKWTNKYPIGVAMFELPFYLVAHFSSIQIPSATYDGYSSPFLLAMMFATIFYTCWGLWFLSRFLSKYFPSKAVIITLISIAFGTNLFIYNCNLPGLSHPFLFFLIAALLFNTDRWLSNPKLKYSFLIGLIIGMCLITRPTAALILVIPLFLFIRQMLVQMPKRSLLHLILTIAGFFLITSIQMLYWHETSGHWIYYSYVEEGFDFLHPHIIDGLFSYRKGWFIYTPIALVGIFGFWPLYKSQQLKKYCLPYLIYFIVVIYVVFSWTAWYYGGGFGARALVESYAVLALPLCAFINKVYAQDKKWMKGAFSTVLVFFICLNLFQTFQFQKGIIPWDGTNKKYYWAIFGDIERSEEKGKLLEN